MAPGGQEGFAMLKRILSILRYGSYIDRSVSWLGVHGSYVPFCKSCMVQLARQLRENNSFTQSSAHQNMTEEDRQVAEKTDEQNMDLALMAGLLSQQFLEKSRDAMEKLPSDDQGDSMAVD
jgi:ribosome-binding protein aMBF1 (putative translation factor)